MIIDQEFFNFPPFPILAGPGSFTDGFGSLSGTLVDNDNDGLARRELRKFDLSWARLLHRCVTWQLTRVNTVLPPDDGSCELSSDGNNTISVSPPSAGPLSVAWEQGNRFTIFITSKNASVDLDPAAVDGYKVTSG